MGYLQPAIAAGTEPISLWHFAKRIAARECTAYVTWFEATATRMRAIDHDRVAASVQRRWPTLEDPELFIRENEARERRAKRLRGWAAHLLASVIPTKVRRELIKDSYLITGRNSAGERVSLTLDDLAGLNIDLDSNSLIGPTTTYTDVSVRPIEASASIEISRSIPTTDTPVRIERRTYVPADHKGDQKRKRRTHGQWVDEADRAVFPDGWGELLVKERDARLIDWIRDRSSSFPEDERAARAIRRYYAKLK
jgi:hypothetical protein